MAEARNTWGVSLTHERARRMRHEPTLAEKLLWRHLRSKRLGGLKFRRQFPIGNFIADFCCRDRKLIIELDGPQHLGKESRDEWRTRKLGEWGYRVLRFPNDEVLMDPEGTLETIWDALEQLQKRPCGGDVRVTPHPCPPLR